MVFFVYGLQLSYRLTFNRPRIKFNQILTYMTVHEVVDRLAHDKVIENIVYRITSSGSTATDPDSLVDLIQDLYLSLLEDKDGKIVDIYEEGHANYYIARMVTNNIMSSSSRYYRNYILPLKKMVEINEQITKDIDARTDIKN